jgi:hypothetical protein
MKNTPSLFHAHIKCPTKCWLRFTGEPATGNTYADWVQSQSESYRDAAIKRLQCEMPQDESTVFHAPESLKTSKWRLGFDVFATSQNLETRLHAVDTLGGTQESGAFVSIGARSRENREGLGNADRWGFELFSGCPGPPYGRRSKSRLTFRRSS